MDAGTVASSPNYRAYLLRVLLVILTFNFADRGVVGIVLQNIKSDLHLSDTQLGLLTGIAFSVFYSVMGIPIARWADRGNRIAIISITCALWGLMVALCGFAGSFFQMLVIRAGVAVGEAGCVPPAHSLIADYFSRAERPRAFSRFMLGGPLSVVVGYFLAGWLNEFYGWRTTFFALGSSGLFLAVLAWFTLDEPRRLRMFQTTSLNQLKDSIKPQAQPTLGEVFRTLRTNSTFMHLLAAFSIMYFFSFGVWQWVPTYFVRNYGLHTGEIGTWFAAIWGGGGILGTFLGGELASRFATNDEKRQLHVMSIVVAGVGAITPMIFITQSYFVAFGVMAFAAIAWSTTYGPWFANIQSVVSDPMRAMAIAIVFLFANLVGMGIGPLMTGMLSDAFRSWAGNDSLRYALLALCPGYLWAAWHIWRAAKTVTRDAAAVTS